jgi:transcriptional antiterminator RfaH
MTAVSSREREAGAPPWTEALHWFAIQAKPRGEEVARHTLHTLGLEVLLPKVRRFGRRESRGSTVRPLFCGYLFGRFSLRQHLHAVRYSRGVVRVVGGHERPVPVDDDVIAACRERMDTEGLVELEEPGFRQGDRLRIESGPFSGFHGIFERDLDDHARVVILLDALQQATLILDRRHLVPAGV